MRKTGGNGKILDIFSAYLYRARDARVYIATNIWFGQIVWVHGYTAFSFNCAGS